MSFYSHPKADHYSGSPNISFIVMTMMGAIGIWKVPYGAICVQKPESYDEGTILRALKLFNRKVNIIQRVQGTHNIGINMAWNLEVLINIGIQSSPMLEIQW